MADDNLHEFCTKTGKAKEKRKGLELLRYGKNLRYDNDGIHNYGTKTANLILRRTIQQLGKWSPTTSTHNNDDKRMLEKRYVFYVPSGRQLIGKTPATIFILEFS